MITTARLHIVPFAEEHLTKRYVAWLNDPEVVKYSEQRHIMHTLESCRTYWKSFQDSPNHFWALETREPALHIGTMTAYVDVPNSIADVGILIGERIVWGKGFGFEAWYAVCQWLFTETAVHKITAGTRSDNHAMLAIMKKAGMVPDGIRKAHYVVAGQSVDVIHMALFNK